MRLKIFQNNFLTYTVSETLPQNRLSYEADSFIL